MAFTPNKNIEQPAHGADVNTWDVNVNSDWAIIDTALGGLATINATGASGTVAITTAQYQPPNIVISGVLTANVNYQFPASVGWFGTISNTTSGAFTITISSIGAGRSITIPQSQRAAVVCDATNVDFVVGYIPVTTTTKLTLLGATSGTSSLQAPAVAGSNTWNLPAADGATGQFLQTDGAGNLIFATPAGGVSLSANNTWTGKQTFQGSSSILAAIFNNAGEIVSVVASPATGTINLNIATSSILYYTQNATANWTINIRHSAGTSLNTALGVGQSVTVTMLATQGGTAYYANVIQVDGSTVTPKWQGGTAPSAGNASGIDVYTFTVIKTANATYTVLATQAQF